MKRPTEHLLDELLEESAPAEFQAALLNQTLSQARRRKRVRNLSLAAGVIIAVFAVVTLTLRQSRSPEIAAGRPVIKAVRQPDLIVINSRPLDPAQIVGTTAGPALVATSPDSGVAMVETRVADRIYAEIDDRQLLALFNGKPVALVHQGPNRAELIFLDPSDAREFLVH